MQLISTAWIWMSGGIAALGARHAVMGLLMLPNPPGWVARWAGGCDLVRRGQCRVVVAGSGGFLGSI